MTVKVFSLLLTVVDYGTSSTSSTLSQLA